MNRDIPYNSKSVTDYVFLVDSTGVPKTGLVAANLTGSYVRQAGARVAITLSDLAAATSAFSAGGLKEVDATNCPGLYRIDMPDAMWVYDGVTPIVKKAYLTFKGATINAVAKEYSLIASSSAVLNTEGSTTETGANPYTFTDGTVRTDN